jgi:hypothetical protein
MIKYVSYQLLMWFWLFNETIELVSGMPVPQFGDLRDEGPSRPKRVV